jgi:23S rRNA pseudouridine1911/1915/1917 synthase
MADSDPPLRSLLDWLAQRYPESPRKRVKEWFLGGRVRLDGIGVRKFHDQVTDPGERLQLVAQAQATGKVEERVRLHQSAKLLFLDGSIAVVNKSIGLLSVPVPGREAPTALDFLAKHLERNGIRNAEALPVHRLDEYTSGLLCFALNPMAREALIAQLRAHKLERTYLAFVEGAPPERTGTWVNMLKLDEEGYRQQLVPAGTPGATEARTDYELLASYRHRAGEGQPDRIVSKIRLRLQTGLKHQIRIQASANGTPLIGDRSYHPAQRGAKRRGKHTQRQALHAVRLGLTHPVSGEHMAWEAPLPFELARFEADLKRQTRGEAADGGLIPPRP